MIEIARRVCIYNLAFFLLKTINNHPSASRKKWPKRLEALNVIYSGGLLLSFPYLLLLSPPATDFFELFRQIFALCIPGTKRDNE